MRFNYRSNLEGKHAFLSPSQYHWIRYDDAKLVERFGTSVAARRGSQLHELAHNLIELKIKLPANGKTLNRFVNEVLGFRMASEQTLYYSEHCFGTADAIGFNQKKNLLQIFDLKTGDSKASVDQLLVYAALFCLEYEYLAFELEYDLRIYQSDDVAKYDVDPVEVAEIMAKIKHFSSMIDELKVVEEV